MKEVHRRLRGISSDRVIGLGAKTRIIVNPAPIRPVDGAPHNILMDIALGWEAGAEGAVSCVAVGAALGAATIQNISFPPKGRSRISMDG